MNQLPVIEVLKQLDIEPRESLLYMALLENGPGSIREISDKAGLNRGTSYELLKKMHERGMVSYFPKGKRRFFSAESPSRLMELALHKKQSVEVAIEKLQSQVLPSLQALRPEITSTQVHYYEGDNGIEWVLKDILATVSQSENKSYSVISTKLIRNFLYRPFPNYTRQRIKAGINVKVLAIGEGGEEAELSERKWIPGSPLSQSAAYIAIYPPKMAMISLTKGDLPAATVIESQPVVATQQLMFDTLWTML